MPWKDLIQLVRLPSIEINLMHEKTAENDPFYRRAVEHYHRIATSRHPKYFFMSQYQYGYAVCPLTGNFEDYLNCLDPAARQNHRRALRRGFEFRRFNFNSQLDGIREIWQSTPVRQGLMPEQARAGRVPRISDPPSLTNWHDYAYFGVFKGDTLTAYAGCLIAGELCSLNDLFGHAAYFNDCVVPMAVIEVARAVLASYPAVKYYAYDNYFGAAAGLRRFKRKFNFLPHRVRWRLRSSAVAAAKAGSPTLEQSFKAASR